MSITELNAEQFPAWNDFVRTHAEGSFFHLAEWKTVLEEAFGCRTYYFYKEEAGSIVGVLPLALVKRPVFGPALISTPLCVYGGALGQSEELVEAAVKKAQELGVEYLELRDHAADPVPNFQTSDRFYTFRRRLSDNHEENLLAIPRKQRAEVRKAMKANLQTEINQDLDTFFKVYSQSVRNLGTPVFSKKYLAVLQQVFSDQFDITTVLHNDHVLSSVLSFYYKDEVLPYYGGGVPQARDYSAYPHMYWQVMEKAAEQGVRVFDFGRSMKGAGAYAFKKNFGFEPMPLHYQYYLVKAREMPNIDPDSPRNRLITSAWKKMPLALANKLGPVLYPVMM
jgi:FemAB-related protein (PEP-CTERM system-associated)